MQVVSGKTQPLPISVTPGEDPCCVCHEAFDASDRAVVQTRCQHLVHLKCISQWFDPSLPLSNRACYSCQSEALPLVLVATDQDCLMHPALAGALEGDLPTLRELLATDPIIISLLFSEPTT